MGQPGPEDHSAPVPLMAVAGVLLCLSCVVSGIVMLRVRSSWWAGGLMLTVGVVGLVAGWL